MGVHWENTGPGHRPCLSQRNVCTLTEMDAMLAAYLHLALLQVSELKIPANMSPKISSFVLYSRGVGALALESDITGLDPGITT